MHVAKKAEITSPNVTLGDGSNGLVMLGGIGGIALIVISCVLATVGIGGGVESFFYVYLANFLFFISISLGALFFVIVQHLTRAGWSVAVRRVAEVMASTIPLLGLLFIPILLAVLVPQWFGSQDGFLYLWNDAKYWQDLGLGLDAPKREYYLNSQFFAVRAVLYFVVWGIISYFFLRTSRTQDENGDARLTLRMQFWSAPCTLLFAITVIFASFDWAMSLAPSWFSTIFPVYFFAGGMMAALCTMILILLVLQKQGIVTQDVTIDHYHDLTKLMFGFIFFWGYIAFSQFLLIWYANIPEETIWYLPRMRGPWVWVSLVLLFGHLLIPFLLLMPRTVRRNRTFLFWGASIMLVMHWLDHFWIVMPQMKETFQALDLEVPSHIGGLVEPLCFLGMLLLYTAFFGWMAGDRPLIPMRDPRLGESLNFKVH